MHASSKGATLYIAEVGKGYVCVYMHPVCSDILPERRNDAES